MVSRKSLVLENGFVGEISSSDSLSIPSVDLLSGSAAVPTLTFTGDTNTGIYSPGADQVAISTNGTGRLFVDASGNVGVGAAPATSLHVTTGASNAQFRLSTASYSTTYYQNTGGSTGVTFPSGQSYIWDAGGSERLRITSTGALNFVGAGTAGVTQAVSFNGSAPVNSLVIDSTGKVGVGTSSPQGNLHVVGAAGGAGEIYVSDVDVSAAAASSLLITQSGNNSFVYNRNTSGQLRLGAGGQSANVVIDTAGNVGIGTTTVQAPLHVGTASAWIDIGASAGNRAKVGYDSNNLILGSSSSAGQFIWKNNVSSTDHPNSSGTERFRCDASGRLLVGTSSDSGGALLQVNGDRIRVGTAKTPASATATGTAGEICWDASYVYVCTATNTWKRSALSTW